MGNGKYLLSQGIFCIPIVVVVVVLPVWGFEFMDAGFLGAEFGVVGGFFF